MKEQDFKKIIQKMLDSSSEFKAEMDRHKKKIEKIINDNIKIDEKLKKSFTTEKVDWVYWFCHENDFGKGKLTAEDKDGNPICRTVEELWEILK